MFSQIINLLSVFVALSAVCVTLWQIRRNQRNAERANALPVITEVFSEARSADFRRHLIRLRAGSPEVPTRGGFDALPEDWRESAYAVGYFFDNLGTLVAHGIIGEKLILGSTGTTLIRMWEILHPFIDAERSWRAGTYASSTSPGFLRYFEHLVARNLELGGKEAASRIQREIGLRSLASSKLTYVTPAEGS